MSSKVKIIAIRRDSDNKVFKVGDIVCSECLYADNKWGVRPMKIMHIDLDINKMARFFNNGVYFANTNTIMKYNKSTFKKLSKDPNFISKYEK